MNKTVELTIDPDRPYQCDLCLQIVKGKEVTFFGYVETLAKVAQLRCYCVRCHVHEPKLKK